MDIQLAGTGETTDVPIILFGIALFFGIMFFLCWFHSWRKQRIMEQREAEYLQMLQSEGTVSDHSTGDHAASD